MLPGEKEEMPGIEIFEDADVIEKLEVEGDQLLKDGAFDSTASSVENKN